MRVASLLVPLERIDGPISFQLEQFVAPWRGARSFLAQQTIAPPHKRRLRLIGIIRRRRIQPVRKGAAQREREGVGPRRPIDLTDVARPIA